MVLALLVCPVLEYLANMCTANGTKKVATFRPIDYENALAIYKLANR